MRLVSWDATTRQLVSFPVEEYALLRNETFIEGESLGAIGPRTSKPIPVASGTGSVSATRSMQQTWNFLQHDGLDHLGFLLIRSMSSSRSSSSQAPAGENMCNLTENMSQ